MDLKNKNKAISILKKVYHYTNTDYETKYDGIVGYKTDFLTEAQKQVLIKHNLIPNSIKKYTHNSLINDLSTSLN